MGYSYCGRKLCCDMCGQPGARKYKCPFGYCQAIALCPECAKSEKGKKARSKDYHRETGCEKAAIEFLAVMNKEKVLLAQGKAVRCAALGSDHGAVHVLFKKADGTCVGYYMSKQAYDSIPLGTPATPEDYTALGRLLEPAPSDFYHKVA